MSLYLVEIKNGDKYYVVGEDPERAYQKLLKILEEENMYFESSRELKSVLVIGKEMYGKDVYIEEE